MAAPTIDEVQFPPQISYGATGGPNWFTNVIETRGGQEQRNQNWTYPREKWNVVTGLKHDTDLATLIAFFNARRGRTYGFRYKNWADFTATDSSFIPVPDGLTKQFQLAKTYDDGSGLHKLSRPIYKPVSSTVVVKKNASVISTGFSFDYTTGLLLFNVTTAATGTESGSTVTISSTAHGLVNGDRVLIEGMTPSGYNGAYTITFVDANTFTYTCGTSSMGAGTGGTVRKIPKATDTLTATFQFDIPARFDADDMKINMKFFDTSEQTLNVIELV